jgi:hypothetical protein
MRVISKKLFVKVSVLLKFKMEKKDLNKIAAKGRTLSESSLREIEVWKNFSLDAIGNIDKRDINVMRSQRKPTALT